MELTSFLCDEGVEFPSEILFNEQKLLPARGDGRGVIK